MFEQVSLTLKQLLTLFLTSEVEIDGKSMENYSIKMIVARPT